MFAALFTAYGTESPFLPAFFGERGMDPGEIGVALAAATVVRLAVTPFIGRSADRLQAARGTLALFGALAGLLSFGYLLGSGFAFLLGLSLLVAFATAPLAPLADAIALPVARQEKIFDYGWVRGVGSGAFIVGTLVSGAIVQRAGLASITVTSGVLFLALAVLTLRAPQAVPAGAGDEGKTAWLDLLRNSLFRRVMVVGALVIGSHALNDTFAVIRWQAAGIGPSIISLLWSASVASEVLVFLLAGPPLLAWMGPARCAALAAAAGCLRWAVLASTDHVAALAAAQLAHGLTFALLHLANMQLITGAVPPQQSASAQTCYASLGLGLSTAVLTAASGFLYAHLGAQAFWLAAVLCAIALPLTAGLHGEAPPR